MASTDGVQPLNLSRVKSSSILFTNKKVNILDPSFRVEEATVPSVNSTAYLGITIYKKLSWGLVSLANATKQLDNSMPANRR